ncbi:MAG: Rpn family recombination-promoting nuclease/putative transposase [Fibrobacter sp.]|nr:Rpn family recombination-promoting nuclease/putative transposase [Fibrobacter sp.]
MENTNTNDDNSLEIRDHDGFFKYFYSVPANARSLLEIASRRNQNLSELLSNVDLGTLESLPSAYNNVGERGEADVAFKAKTIGNEVGKGNRKEVYVGLLLEHKSYDDSAVLEQIYRYMFNVMVNKNDTKFPWMPSKAIIIYNGRKNWDPLAAFRRGHRAKFQGHDLPFECVLVNMADIEDDDCITAENPEAALGALVMKHSFDAKAIEVQLPIVEDLLRKLPNMTRYLIVEKIKVYLEEFLSKEAIMELEQGFVSIGQRLGFESAGDYRRKLEAQNRAKDAEIASQAADLAAKEAEIAALKAQIAALTGK